MQLKIPFSDLWLSDENLHPGMHVSHLILPLYFNDAILILRNIIPTDL